MNDIDRKIATHLYVAIRASNPETIEVEGYRMELGWVIVSLKTGQEINWCWQTAELCWEHAGFNWSQDIAAALALVEELEILIELKNVMSMADGWVAKAHNVGDRGFWNGEGDTPAGAVAAAILAWLEAQEAER